MAEDPEDVNTLRSLVTMLRKEKDVLDQESLHLKAKIKEYEHKFEVIDGQLQEERQKREMIEARKIEKEMEVDGLQRQMERLVWRRLDREKEIKKLLVCNDFVQRKLNEIQLAEGTVDRLESKIEGRVVDPLQDKARDREQLELLLTQLTADMERIKARAEVDGEQRDRKAELLKDRLADLSAKLQTKRDIEMMLLGLEESTALLRDSLHREARARVQREWLFDAELGEVIGRLNREAHMREELRREMLGAVDEFGVRMRLVVGELAEVKRNIKQGEGVPQVGGGATAVEAILGSMEATLGSAFEQLAAQPKAGADTVGLRAKVDSLSKDVRSLSRDITFLRDTGRNTQDALASVLRDKDLRDTQYRDASIKLEEETFARLRLEEAMNTLLARQAAQKTAMEDLEASIASVRSTQLEVATNVNVLRESLSDLRDHVTSLAATSERSRAPSDVAVLTSTGDITHTI